MKAILQKLKSADTCCMLWVAVCFTLTSAVYLSWLDRLVALAGAQGADWLSMVVGYLFQAAGMGLTAMWLKKKPDGNHQRNFMLVSVLFIAVSVPALITNSATGVTAFGWLMNGLCGVIAGAYLYGIGIRTEGKKRSIVFGGGYAIATVAVGVLALIGGGVLLHGNWSLPVFVLMTAGMMVVTYRTEALKETDAGPVSAVFERKELLSAFGIVILISLVKNLGFGFPSADIQAGLIPEISRIPYAAGLVAAGLINAKSRRYGMICTIAAMIIPFLMLGLLNEPISATIFWGLDYVFFAFFSVFRAVLFLDLAGRTKHWELAALGLLAGRLGDAAGTAANLLLGGYKVLLIGVAGTLFIPAVFLLFRLYERLYDKETLQARLDREKFKTFCENHDLSAREREIFQQISENRTNGEIAEKLFITENTVKYHVRNILQKTGCRNRSELLRKYTTGNRPETEEQDKPQLHIVS